MCASNKVRQADSLTWTRYTVLAILLMGVHQGITSAEVLPNVGQVPTPILRDVQVQGEASFSVGTGLYSYTYTVTNPGTNTGDIWRIEIDMTTQVTPVSTLPAFDSTDLTIPSGAAGFLLFEEVLADIEPLELPAGRSLLPFGQEVPPDWLGGLDVNGFAGFSSRDSSSDVLPGTNLSGFELQSRGMPTIRRIQVIPHWMFVVDSEEEVTPEMQQLADQINEAIVFHTFTLGPSALTPGTFGHWDRLRDDLDQAIQLGWIPDAALANTLVTQLASAREALDDRDGTLAKTRLQTLIETVTQSTPAQRRSEVEGLVRLNAEKLIESTPDTPIPFEPQASLSPESTTVPIGTLYTLTATVVNLGDPANPPVPNFELGFEVVEGPNEGLESSGETNAQGQLSFSYTSTQVGADKIVVGVPAVLPEFAQPLQPETATYKILVRSVVSADTRLPYFWVNTLRGARFAVF